MVAEQNPGKAWWLKNSNLWKIRISVQAAFALFCLYCGYRFYYFYLWAIGVSDQYVPRPPAVEAFLPISGLVGLKRFLLSGVYDPIHPAGLTIFIAALLIALLFRKGFCGWICPVGFTSNLAERFARRIKILWSPPLWLDYPLMSLKYLLLGFFAFLILLKMGLHDIEAFNRSPYNLVVDAKMLLFFIEPTVTTIWVMSFLIAASFLLRNFWCRYLCPYGALLGILSFFSPVGVVWNSETCIDCRKCEKVCPGSIVVPEKEKVTSPECIGCLECVSACPVGNCLQVSAAGRWKLPPLVLPLAILGLFFLLWGVANLTGHWHSEVPMDLLKRYYQMSSQLAHP